MRTSACGSTGFTALAMQRGPAHSSIYYTTTTDPDSKICGKLDLVNGIDPYEILRNKWQDNINLWPAITHAHVCIYTQAPDTEDLLNYKSLECHQRFYKRSTCEGC